MIRPNLHMAARDWSSRGWREDAERPLAALRAGVRYVFSFAPIGNTLLLVAAASFTGFAAPVILPILARDVFGGDARTLGWLKSASGVGALGGAIYLSTRTTVRGLGTVIVLGGHGDERGIDGDGVLPHDGTGDALCMMFLGAGGVLLMASSNTVVQSLTDDDKRGRVMSLFAMAFTGHDAAGQSGHRCVGGRTVWGALDAGGVRDVLRVEHGDGISCGCRNCACHARAGARRARSCGSCFGQAG